MASRYDWSDYIHRQEDSMYEVTQMDSDRQLVVRRVRWGRVCLALFVFAGFIFAIVSVIQTIVRGLTGSPEQVSTASSPAAEISPNTPIDAQTYDRIENVASELSGDDAFLEGTMQHEALGWLLVEAHYNKDHLDTISQRYALVVLLFSLSQNYSSNEIVQDYTSECEWMGITCNADGFVTKISLTSMNFAGQIPKELGVLTTLEWLDLSDNQLEGNIPEELGDLESLKKLYIQRNGGRLTTVGAEGGRSPSVPATVCSLREKNLADLEMDCETEGVVSCSCCTKCFSFVSNMSHDENIASDANIFNTTNDTIAISDQGFAPMESIRSTLAAVSCLESDMDAIDILDSPQRRAFLELANDDNQLSDSALIERYAISVLYFSLLEKSELNLWSITDQDVCTWDGFECDGGSVTEIDLGGRQLVGKLPNEVTCLSRLQHLDLANNAISGTVPPGLSSLTNLNLLYLHQNQLKGTVDRTICQLRYQNLQHFVVDCEVECDCCTSCGEI